MAGRITVSRKYGGGRNLKASVSELYGNASALTKTVPPGAIVPSLCRESTGPVGWLPCDGRVVSIQDYGDLYAAIGPEYGGNGTTTFAVPDLRGRICIGVGTDTVTYPAQKLGVISDAIAAGSDIEGLRVQWLIKT